MAKAPVKRGPGRPRKNPEAVPKRGPGRPRKNPLGPAPAHTGARRGRPPGSKNASKRGFLENVIAQADIAEKGLETLLVTIDKAFNAEVSVRASPESKAMADSLAILAPMKETLTHAMNALAGIDKAFVPGAVEMKPAKVLVWEREAFAVFKNPALIEQFGKDAFQITGIIELGKGPGNGTLVQLHEAGCFPKSMLELVDGDEFAEDDGADLVSETKKPKAPKASAPVKGNGIHAVAPEVVARAAQIDDNDDLNA